MQICRREHAFHFHGHFATAHSGDLTVRIIVCGSSRIIHITKAERINITSRGYVQGMHLKTEQ